MIKFRCSNCNQKLGVPEEYAGRRVRCTKCRQVATVPEPEPELIEIEQPFVDATVDETFSSGMWIDELASSNIEAGPIVEVERPQRPLGRSVGSFGVKCKHCGTGNDAGTGFCIGCGEQIIVPKRTPGRKGKGRPGATDSHSGVMSGFAAGAGKLPLALVTSVIFTLVGALAWAGACSMSGRILFGFLNPLLMLVCALAGVGLTLFTGHRNFAIGMIAVVIGTGGMMTGKAFYAKWHSIPKMEEVFESEEFSSEAFGADSELTDEELDDIVNNPNEMFRYACGYIAEEEGWDDMFAFRVRSAQMFGKRNMELTAQESEKIDLAIAYVEDTIDSWSYNEKCQVVKVTQEKIHADVTEFAEDLTKGMTQAFGYITAFRFLDLLWFPMGMWSAYKIGSGRD